MATTRLNLIYLFIGSVFEVPVIFPSCFCVRQLLSQQFLVVISYYAKLIFLALANFLRYWICMGTVF